MSRNLAHPGCLTLSEDEGDSRAKTETQGMAPQGEVWEQRGWVRWDDEGGLGVRVGRVCKVRGTGAEPGLIGGRDKAPSSEFRLPEDWSLSVCLLSVLPAPAQSTRSADSH